MSSKDELGPNKLLVITALVLFLAGLTVVSFDAQLDMPLVSGLFIVLMALPSYYAFWRYAGARRSVVLLILLSVLPLLVEAQAVVTGFPYGDFQYSQTLGGKLFGLVPWTVAFAYLPILLGSFAMASRFWPGSVPLLIAGSALILTIADLVLDPAIVHAGLWIWADGGPYYGIPTINFLGWVLTGLIYSAILYVGLRELLKTSGPVPIGVASSLLLIMALWTGYVMNAGLLIPSLIGFALTSYLAIIFLKPVEGIRQ